MLASSDIIVRHWTCRSWYGTVSLSGGFSGRLGEAWVEREERVGHGTVHTDEIPSARVDHFLSFGSASRIPSEISMDVTSKEQFVRRYAWYAHLKYSIEL